MVCRDCAVGVPSAEDCSSTNAKLTVKTVQREKNLQKEHQHGFCHEQETAIIQIAAVKLINGLITFPKVSLVPIPSPIISLYFCIYLNHKLLKLHYF